ncbi:hypothetical protein RND81_13G121900 [Saponaria officinalis]|uniref:Uncharacterized protein n=1 Tax=Saponaria officinalis TaxID=3572 RepID=A0AAW1GZQ5_SAPOF
MDSSIAVSCIHNHGYRATTSDIIQPTILRQDYHRLPDNRLEETTTVYSPINPDCEECEEALLRHLTMDLSLSYFSAENVVHSLRVMVHHTRQQLIDTKTTTHYGGPLVEEVCYRLNCFFESTSDCDCEDDGIWVNSGLGSSFERLVKVTSDGGWALYNQA